MKPKLDERSAVYVNTPDPSRVPLDLSADERARLAHLEGMVTTLLAEVEEMRAKIEEREGDHK
jgi:hypothetical protein